MKIIASLFTFARPLVLMASLIMTQISFAQNNDEYSIKALLIYNIAKFAKWNESDNDSALLLCYMDRGFKTGFDRIAGKTVGSRVVSVRQIMQANEAGDCDIIFIDNKQRAMLNRLFISLKGKPGLTVSDINGFVDDGGMVEVHTIDSKLRISINLTPLEESSLTLNSQLLALAIKVKR